MVFANLPTKYAINAAIRTETMADGPATCRTTYPMPMNTAIASVELKPTFAKSNKFMWCFGGAFVVVVVVVDAVSVSVGAAVAPSIVIDAADTVGVVISYMEIPKRKHTHKIRSIHTNLKILHNST